MTKKLYKSADGIRAPKGWMFQDNSKDFIALLKVSKKEKWTIEDWRGDKIPKDAYISAEHFKNIGWIITAYAPNEGHGSGRRTYGKKNTIKEIKRLARFHDNWEKGWRP